MKKYNLIMLAIILASTLLATLQTPASADPIVRWVMVESSQTHSVVNSTTLTYDGTSVCGASDAIRGYHFTVTFPSAGSHIIATHVNSSAWYIDYPAYGPYAGNATYGFGVARTGDTDVVSSDPMSTSGYIQNSAVDAAFGSGATYPDTMELFFADINFSRTFDITTTIYFACSNSLPTATPQPATATPTPTPTNSPTATATTSGPTPTNSPTATATTSGPTPTPGPTLNPGIPDKSGHWYWTRQVVNARVEKIGDVAQTNQTVTAYGNWAGAGDAVFVAINHNGGSGNGLWVKTAYKPSDWWYNLYEGNGKTWNGYTSFVTANPPVDISEIIRVASSMGYSRIDTYNSTVPVNGADLQAQWAAGADMPPWGPTAGYAEITTVDVLHYDPQRELECKPWGSIQTYDLTKVGTLVSGSYTSVPQPDGNIQIDASLTYTLPSPVYGEWGTTTAGLLWDVTPNAQSNLPAPATLVVNNSVYTGDTQVSSNVLPGVNIALVPGVKTINVRFSQHLPVYLSPSVLNRLLLTVTIQNPFGTGLLNCDGDMELHKDVTPWKSLQPKLDLGRISTDDLVNFSDPLDGAPACGYGFQAVGTHPFGSIFAKEAGTAFEFFTVPYTGTFYYKFRYRSAAVFSGLYQNSPNVYIVKKNDPSQVMDLIGAPGKYDAVYSKSAWTLVRGTVQLGAGNYGIYLSGANKDYPVYYDDVYFSTLPFDETCTAEKLQDIPATPGPTATEASTLAGTPASPTPGSTGVTPTPGGTSTPWPTFVATARSTATPDRTPGPSPTPGPSNTPGGPTATAGPSPTPGGPTSTPEGAGQNDPDYTWIPSLPICITCIPDTWKWPNNPDPSNPIIIRFDPWHPAPTNPLPDGYVYAPWTGDPNQDCRKPEGWDMIKVNLWLDYEVCTIISFVSLTPPTVSGFVQMTGQLNNYEPFGTISEVNTTVTMIKATAQSYAWNNTGVAGTSDTIDILAPLHSWGPDAWAENAKPFDFTVNGGANWVYTPYNGPTANNPPYVQPTHVVPTIDPNIGPPAPPPDGYPTVDPNIGPALPPPTIRTPTPAYVPQPTRTPTPTFIAGMANTGEMQLSQINPAMSVGAINAASEASLSNAYSGYCNTKMSTMLGGNMARGMCYALNFTRKIGMLAWIQLFLNIASILGIIRFVYIWITKGYQVIVSMDPIEPPSQD